MNINMLSSGSHGNAYIVNNDLLIECGLPINQLDKLSGRTLHGIQTCFVSHAHQDHIRAIRDIARLGIDIYLSSGAKEQYEAETGMQLEGWQYHIANSGKMITVQHYNILPFAVHHDHPFMPCKEPLGCQITDLNNQERLVYITDTSHTEYTFRDVTHWMIECNHSNELIDKSLEAGDIPISLYNRIRHTHLSLEQCIAFFQANDLQKTQKIFLIHISGNHGCSDSFRKAIQGVTGLPVYVI